MNTKRDSRSLDEDILFPLLEDVPETDDRKCRFDDDRETGLPKTSVTKSDQRSRQIQFQWRRAGRKAVSLSDPWNDGGMNELPIEWVTRLRYNTIKKNWVTDRVQVRMESDSFARGAMRYCFRLKKPFIYKSRASWKYNYVAKRYIEPVENQVYFDDVKLQMNAKLWAEEYNRHRPPKKVDIMQLAILQFNDRPGVPLYHMENYIEGNYTKYNSNSGFVEDDDARCTPQAFSHFTFERSFQRLMIVDVQGVGDLYTDPQIHTAGGEEYGDGNLGTKGMALFFYSHICNNICTSMDLNKFALHSTEEDQLKIAQLQSSCKTVSRTSESVLKSRSYSSSIHVSISETTSADRPQSPDEGIGSASPRNSDFITEVGVQLDARCDSAERLNSRDSVSRGEDQSVDDDADCSQRNSWLKSYNPASGSYKFRRNRLASQESLNEDAFTRRLRLDSYITKLETEGIDVADREGDDVGIAADQLIGQDQFTEEIISGDIHLQLSKYHEMGRFCKEKTQEGTNQEAAFYHLECAANCDILEAVVAVSLIYLGLPNDVLPDYVVTSTDDTCKKGIKYLEEAAYRGDRQSMILFSKALQYGTSSGYSLPKDHEQDWIGAVHYLEESVNAQLDDEGVEYNDVTEDPLHTLYARLALMHAVGGNHLRKDVKKASEFYNEAAEAAMAAMKGRIATWYYMEAEAVLSSESK